jgi:hypothetical protein
MVDIKFNWVSSKVFGTDYNSTEFDDRKFVENLDKIVIKEIVTYSNGYLCGIQVFYEKDGSVTSNGCHSDIDFNKIENYDFPTTSDGAKAVKKSFAFSEGEEISKLIVQSGDIIDGFGFETNYGNKYYHGGEGGGLNEYSLSNLKFCALSGTVATIGVENYWRTIHSLQFHLLDN